MSQALCFLQITAKLQDYPFLTVFLIIKTSSQNISMTLLKISLKSNESSLERLWKNSSQCREILLHVKQVMGSFRCYGNCDVIETLIITSFHLRLVQLCSPPEIFQNLCLQQRSLFSNVGGIDLEQLRRATSAITSWIVFFARNVANYGQFFHKIKFARTFKKCFLSTRFGSRKYFFCHN